MLSRAALLCLHNAKEGGLSSWSSSISVHNEIVRRRPDLARVLAGPWFMDRKARAPGRVQETLLHALTQSICSIGLATWLAWVCACPLKVGCCVCRT